MLIKIYTYVCVCVIQLHINKICKYVIKKSHGDNICSCMILYETKRDR